ncbi:MAG: sulfotransferase domain-containing protein, partial [Polaribacter sp.]|nr:sulfotransferase domain-containing protein [Polaribacter sp.]
RYNTSENLSFEEAIEKSEERYQKNNDMTPDTRYLHVGMYYNQVKKYMDEFGKNVHVVIYDDYVSNINRSIKRVFDFLKVNNIEMDTSQRHMVGGWIFKNPILRKLMVSKNGLKSFVKLLLPSSSLRKKIRTIIMRFGTSKTPELTTKMRKFLEDYYRDDIVKLENLIDKDLNWNK